MPMSSGNDQASITGTAVCTKCQLKQTAACQNAIQVKSKGKVLTYYLVDSPVTGSFHDELARDGKKIMAVGSIQQSDGRLELIPTKIAIVK
jgi:hypothetical protein